MTRENTKIPKLATRRGRKRSGKLVAIAATALLAFTVLVPSASAITIIDWVKVSLEEEGIPVPVTIPCGGERINLGGTVSFHFLLGDDGRVEYRVNAEDAVGTDVSTGEMYRLVGAASGDLRPGESTAVVLFLVGEPRQPVPVGLLFRTAGRNSTGLPEVSLASIRVLQTCDPGTLTLSDAGFGGFGDYMAALVGTALEPSSLVSIYGVRSRGGVAYETVLLGTTTVQSGGTVGELLYPRCADGQFLYATGTSASGNLVTSNTFASPC
jgi:hypothetical protein